MATIAQIEANRANAQKSTGPRTPEGKARSSQNALDHGLTGHTMLHPDFQGETYLAYREAMLADLAPATTLELDLARRIVHDSWRLNRAGALDCNLLADTIATRGGGGLETGDPELDHGLAAARAFREEAKTFNLLTLYEQRLQRAVLKNLAALKAMQKERAEKERAEEERAAAKNQVEKAMTATAQPQPIEISLPQAEIGFVFSSAAQPPDSPPEAVENALENMAA